MRLFGKNTEIEIKDIRIGHVRIAVRENIIDRLTGFFSPEWKLRRLHARGALDGAGQTHPPARRVISAGIKPPVKDGFSAYGRASTARRLGIYHE